MQLAHWLIYDNIDRRKYLNEAERDRFIRSPFSISSNSSVGAP